MTFLCLVLGKEIFVEEIIDKLVQAFDDDLKKRTHFHYVTNEPDNFPSFDNVRTVEFFKKFLLTEKGRTKMCGNTQLRGKSKLCEGKMIVEK